MYYIYMIYIYKGNEKQRNKEAGRQRDKDSETYKKNRDGLTLKEKHNNIGTYRFDREIMPNVREE